MTGLTTAQQAALYFSRKRRKQRLGVIPAPPGIGLPAITLATFDGTPSAGVVMSNGNLTATHGTSNNGAGVQSTMTKTTGKYYFEATIQVGTFPAHGVGFRTYTAGAFTDVVGTFANGVGVGIGTNCFIYNNAVNTNKNLGSVATNDVFGIAVDLTAKLAWLRRNNGLWNADAAANPVTGANGVTVPAGAMSAMVRFTNSGPTHVWTGNFGQSAFAFAAPSGFDNWGV